MLARGRTEFPSLGFSGPPFDAVATRRPDEFGGWGRANYVGLAGLGQMIDTPWTPWSTRGDPTKRFQGAFAGMGQVDFSNVFGGLSLQTVLLFGLGGWLAWKMFFGTTAQVRRRALGEARKKYRADVREIRSKYPRFG